MRLLKEVLHNQAVNIHGLTVSREAVRGIIVDQRRLQINQTHTYRDLFMPISITEKRLFDAIDGARTIGDIAARALPSAPEKSPIGMARTFFERLWWYDQVVFDLTGQGDNVRP
jgi:hypothetical protein